MFMSYFHFFVFLYSLIAIHWIGTNQGGRYFSNEDSHIWKQFAADGILILTLVLLSVEILILLGGRLFTGAFAFMTSTPFFWYTFSLPFVACVFDLSIDIYISIKKHKRD